MTLSPAPAKARKPRLRTYRVRSGTMDVKRLCPYDATPEAVALLCLEQHAMAGGGNLAVVLEVSGRSLDDTLCFDTMSLLRRIGRAA